MVPSLRDIKVGVPPVITPINFAKRIYRQTNIHLHLVGLTTNVPSSKLATSTFLANLPERAKNTKIN
jgi:hypothetical protein